MQYSQDSVVTCNLNIFTEYVWLDSKQMNVLRLEFGGGERR